MALLSAEEITVDSYDEGIEYFYEKGWTDGFPVILPTPDKVQRFLDAVGLEPGAVIGDVRERHRVITAENAAINAVMAGCKPEYFPVVVAAIRAVTAPEFEFNHLASMGSPWPVLIVSGRVVKDLGLHHGGWMLGPSSRVNSTIGRAFSLALWNCAELRPSGIQRGTYGNPLRWSSGVIAEDPGVAASESLRVHLGFDEGDSTVTAISNCGSFTQPWVMKPDPVETLQALADAIVAGSGNFNRGAYTILMAPPIVERMHSAGWTFDDIREWLFENTGRSLASLKRRGFPPAGDAHRLWATDPSHASGSTFEDRVTAGAVDLEDDEVFIKIFRDNGDCDRLIWSESQRTRTNDIFLVMSGAEVSYGCIVLPEYDVSTDPVTVRIPWGPAS